MGYGQPLIFLLLLLSFGDLFAPGAVSVADDGYLSVSEHTLVRMIVSEDVEKLVESVSPAFNGGIMVLHKGRPVYTKTAGLADLRSHTVIELDSPFQLASVSKIFTATAVLQLQEQGLVHLDSAICTYLPEWPYKDQCVRNLLTHRSGLSRYMAVAGWYWPDKQVPLGNQDVFNQFVQHEPLTFFTPDSGFNYCNTNYVVLAEMVERVSGKSFPCYMQDHIFDPLEMHNAFIYSKSDSTLVPEVKGYKPGRRRYNEAWKDYIDGVWGDKNVYASLSDIQKFEAALWDGSILSDRTLADMWTPGSPERQFNYGLGWRIRLHADRYIPYHFGWWRGFRTCYIHDPESGIGLIMLSNMDDSRRLPGYWETYDSLKNIWPVLQDS